MVDLKRAAKALALFSAATYALDVLARPSLVASRAINYSRSIGKPVINVGAGTPRSSLRAAVLGPTLWGDVNIDLAADKRIPHGPDQVSFGDAHRLPWPDKHFGSLIASHVLEHLDDPTTALAEWQRVADRVYVIVPEWWATHTYAHPDHKWLFLGGFGYPLWNRNRRAIAVPSFQYLAGGDLASIPAPYSLMGRTARSLRS